MTINYIFLPVSILINFLLFIELDTQNTRRNILLNSIDHHCRLGVIFSTAGHLDMVPEDTIRDAIKRCIKLEELEKVSFR